MLNAESKSQKIIQCIIVFNPQFSDEECTEMVSRLLLTYGRDTNKGVTWNSCKISAWEKLVVMWIFITLIVVKDSLMSEYVFLMKL